MRTVPIPACKKAARDLRQCTRRRAPTLAVQLHAALKGPVYVQNHVPSRTRFDSGFLPAVKPRVEVVRIYDRKPTKKAPGQPGLRTGHPFCVLPASDARVPVRPCSPGAGAEARRRARSNPGFSTVPASCRHGLTGHAARPMPCRTRRGPPVLETDCPRRPFWWVCDQKIRAPSEVGRQKVAVLAAVARL